MFKESVKMALENIFNNRMRSFLTMLGIIIGVASIIALITIVSGATGTVTSEVESLGANKITLQVIGTPLKKGLTQGEVEELKRIPNLSGVAPTISGKTNVAYGDSSMEDITLQGKNEDYFANTKDVVSIGRSILPIDIESENRVALIGKNIVNDLYFGIDPIGLDIKIGGITYKVIGVLVESNGFSSTDQNNAVIIPYTTAMGFIGNKYINNIDFFVTDDGLADTTTKEIEAYLKQTFLDNEDAYMVFNFQNMLDTFATMTGVLSMMLAGIASISLVVGGIGIMNMMLVSVTERTVEIGLRKALGAEPFQIQIQFLVESIILSILGGIIGFLLGAGIAWIVCNGIGTEFILTGSTVTLAIGFSAGIGIIFGITPARKASKLNPIDALRSI
ncbi:MAG: ABC transporter permease [Eubacteriaceae bacterium]